MGEDTLAQASGFGVVVGHMFGVEDGEGGIDGGEGLGQGAGRISAGVVGGFGLQRDGQGGEDVAVIVDQRANRMRILVPISSADGLSADELLRLLQANFDTALDARYAVANGRLWSTFIHPLAELQGEQLISGLAQTVTLAQTYGDTYTSGAIMFGGGDTRGLMQELLDLGQEL